MTTPQAPDEEARRVGFILAGVQKAGTTSLFEMLAQHSQIAESMPKELHFFDNENRKWNQVTYRRYHRKINWQPASKIAGEATPSYVFWPGAMARIKTYNPQMRLLLSFRDPIERAFSQWGMWKQRDGELPDFTETVRQGWATRWSATAEEATALPYTFVARGFYGAQLRTVLDLFPREQILLLDFRNTFADLAGSLDTITDFLDIDRFEAHPAESGRRQGSRNLRAAAPLAAEVAVLAGVYADDLACFAELSGLDVSGWPTSQILRGELDPAELVTRMASKAGIPVTKGQIRKVAKRDAKKAAKKAKKVEQRAAGEAEPSDSTPTSVNGQGVSAEARRTEAEPVGA